ncbi:MAG: phosphoribosyltransferase [Acidimicrobiia bacterium]
MRLSMRYRNRVDAGIKLAESLSPLRESGFLVVGLPRGGVVVAAEVAKALDAPLDVILVRKLGVRYQPELAMGAIGEGGVRFLDEAMVRRAGLSQRDIDAVEERELANLDRAALRFRGDNPPLDLSGQSVIIVDDGIATGATVMAACEVARRRAVEKLVVAAPIGSTAAIANIRLVADETICPTSDRFMAISQYYADFSEISDEGVFACLDAARRRIDPG